MRLLIIATLITWAGAAKASNGWEGYFELGSVETVEIPTEAMSKALPKAKAFGTTKPSAVVVTSEADKLCMQAEAKGMSAEALNLSQEDLQQIVAIGKQIWTLVQENKPVVNVKTDQIAVLPLKAECWKFLEGWQNPVVRTYRTTFKNLFGVNVVDFQYKVIALTGGSYRGAGKYLARTAIVPETVEVAWGYTFNAAVTVPTVLNYGTVVDPVASVELEMTYSVDTVLKHFQSTKNYLIKGNGESLAL